MSVDDARWSGQTLLREDHGSNAAVVRPDHAGQNRPIALGRSAAVVDRSRRATKSVVLIASTVASDVGLEAVSAVPSVRSSKVSVGRQTQRCVWRIVESMRSPTFIAIVDFTVNAPDRLAALAQLERERPVVQSMPGCIGFRFFQSPQDETALTVLHEWSDQDAFNGYLSSPSFAHSGEHLRPKLTAAPSSRRFHVELVETVA